MIRFLSRKPSPELIEALQRDKQDISIGYLVPSDAKLSAVTAAKPLTLEQRRAYIALLAMGDNWSSAANLAARIPDDMVDVALTAIRRPG